MSKYLRTLLAALLVIALAVTGAMATEEFPKIARELIWVTGASTVTANPDTGALIIRDKKGAVVEYTGSETTEYDSLVKIIDPYMDNSTLGEILKNVFFVETATEAEDLFNMRRLGGYAFKFRGEGLPQAFVSYNEDSHRYWIPQKLYDVEWVVSTDDADLEISYDINVDNDTIVISGLAYPNPEVSKDYKITLIGTPYLTSVGEKYYTFDYIEDAMANFPLKWSMTIHVYHDGRVVLTPESGDIMGVNVFNRMVTPASGVKIHEVSMNDANYRVTIKGGEKIVYNNPAGVTGTIIHTYKPSLYPADFVAHYAYIGEINNTGASDTETLLYTLPAGQPLYTPASSIPQDEDGNPVAGTYLIPLFVSDDADIDFKKEPDYFIPVTVTATEDEETGEVTYTYSLAGSELVAATYDEETEEYDGDFYFTPDADSDGNYMFMAKDAPIYVHGGLLDFDPSKIVYVTENGSYVYSADKVFATSYDIKLYSEAEDGYAGSNIRGFAVQFAPTNESNDAGDDFLKYPVYAAYPFVYDGVYFPEGLVLVANYGAELYATADIEDLESGDSTVNILNGGLISRSSASGRYVMENVYDVMDFVNKFNAATNFTDQDEFTASDLIVGKTAIINALDNFNEAAMGMLGESTALGVYVNTYVVSYDKGAAEKYVRGVHAGKVMRVTVPLVCVVNDAYDDIVRSPLGRTLASNYILQWDVIFSGDVEEEAEPEAPVTPVIAISGDTTVTNGVVGTGYNFVLSYDTDLFGYTLDPEDAEYVEEGIDEDGNEIITITPTGTGNFSVKVTPYDLASKDNKGSAVTLTVTVPLPGQLAATFNPATVTVKAGETATSTLEITNTKTGSPAVKEVSPAADWVTYEPRFINGGAFYEFKFAPAATMTAGTHTFTVTVSDDDKTTSAVVTVNVTAAGGDDPTPGPTPSTPAAPSATDLATFQAALVDNTTTSASVVVAAPSGVTVSSWKVYDNGTEVTDTSKVVITNNLPNQSARITVYPDAFDAGDHTLTARYVTTDSTTSNALTLGSFTVADVPVVPVVGKSGGGGCDAGFGALALVAVSLFLLKKRS